MTYDDLIKFYETPAKAAAARDLDRQVLHGWKTRGSIPLEQQIEWEIVTKGALRADVPQEFRENAA